MIVRISLLITLLAWGAWSGGFTGFFACFLLAGLLGAFFPYHGNDEAVPEATGGSVRPAKRPAEYEDVPARRGQVITRVHRDPTRPRW